MQIKCIFAQRNILAESPLWHPQEQALYWVDIPQCTLHKLDINTTQHHSWQLPSEIGCIGLHADGGLVAALRTGFAHIALPSGKVTMLNEPLKDDPTVMFNDGKCDRQGRFWAGSKDVKEQQPLGSIYRLQKNNAVVTVTKGFTVSNGLAWSPDNKIMYICDSPTRHIYQYDYDANTGDIRNQGIFATLLPEAGYPDGLTVDSEGYVWSAHWNGSRITRYHPNGTIDSVIELPVPYITSCCFGGKNFNTLFITTASRDHTPAELKQFTQAGYLFSIDLPIKGLAEPAYSAV